MRQWWCVVMPRETSSSYMRGWYALQRRLHQQYPLVPPALTVGTKGGTRGYWGLGGAQSPLAHLTWEGSSHPLAQ